MKVKKRETLVIFKLVELVDRTYQSSKFSWGVWAQFEEQKGCMRGAEEQSYHYRLFHQLYVRII